MSHARLALIVLGVVLGCGGFPARSASAEIKKWAAMRELFDEVCK
jgi:hypothetical protein